MALDIDAQTARYALVGEKLSHTWSPQIHNALFARARANAVYIAMPTPRNALPALMDVLRHCFAGWNVTIPYKQDVLPYLDALDDTVRMCGAVNTVRVTPDARMIGYNTDGAGMMDAIEAAGIRTRGVRALVLGSGGTARAAAYMLLLGGGDVTVSARNAHAARALIADLHLALPHSRTRLRAADSPDETCRYDLLLNCTPVGMYPDMDACPAAPGLIARCGAVFDAIYNPAQTRLLRAAREAGCAVVGGFGMLLRQAVAAQRIWFGAEPGADDVREVERALTARLGVL